jgi:hypothetical protein
MATPITTGSFPKALAPGVNAFYGKAYNEYPVEWDKLFEKYTSKRNFEEDVGTTSFGLAIQKGETSPVSYDTERQGFVTRYTHVVYGLGFMISEEAIDDDQYDVVGSRRAQGLAFSIRQTKEVIGHNVYNRAFNAAFTGGDGVSLLANNHPNVAGGTWSNILATASDVSEAALEQACIQIQGFTNDRGLAISIKPQKIIVPYQQEFELARILKAVGRTGTDTNDINAIKELGIFPGGMMTSHYMTDSDAWFIRTNAPHGMKYFSRKDDSFDSDNDFDTKNAKFMAMFRCSFGWSDARGLFGSAGA